MSKMLSLFAIGHPLGCHWPGLSSRARHWGEVLRTDITSRCVSFLGKLGSCTTSPRCGHAAVFDEHFPELSPRETDSRTAILGRPGTSRQLGNPRVQKRSSPKIVHFVTRGGRAAELQAPQHQPRSPSKGWPAPPDGAFAGAPCGRRGARWPAGGSTVSGTGAGARLASPLPGCPAPATPAAAGST